MNTKDTTRKQNGKTISDRLKLLRARKRISSQKLADILKIPQPTYATYEIGKIEPSIEIIKRLAKYYNVTTDFLIGIDYETFNLSTDLKEECEDELYTIAKLTKEYQNNLIKQMEIGGKIGMKLAEFYFTKIDKDKDKSKEYFDKINNK